MSTCTTPRLPAQLGRLRAGGYTPPLALVAALLLAVQPGQAAQTAAPAASARPAAKPAPQRQRLKSQAKALALASETVENLNAAQLEIAARVLTGTADCEFSQTVAVAPLEGHPGHFRVGFKKAVYTMVPQETSTGAVRLEDKKAGVMWLQIPAKSMLMNSKLGQRMVDSCLHPEQRAAVGAANSTTDPVANSALNPSAAAARAVALDAAAPVATVR